MIRIKRHDWTLIVSTVSECLLVFHNTVPRRRFVSPDNDLFTVVIAFFIDRSIDRIG
jgi:hypothetical protein